MDRQALAGPVDERQRRERLEALPRVGVRKQGAQQRSRDATDDRRRLEQLTRVRVQLVEVDQRELVEQPVERDVAERAGGVLTCRERAEHQGERMSPGEPDDRVAGDVVDAEQRQQLRALGGRQRTES